MSDTSISFERLADVYDRTRGGVERGTRFASDISPWLDDRPGPILDIGVGTGAVALPLHLRVQRPVFGVDLSPAMLAKATGRLGAGHVLVADASCLPLPDRSVPDVVAVWLLQVVADPAAVVGEVARVLRPGGRFVALLGRPEARPTDLDDLLPSWHDLLGRQRRDEPHDLHTMAAAAGLRLVDQAATSWLRWESSPLDEVRRIEERTYGPLIDVDDEAWEAKVQPIVDALRRLPAPDLPRRRASRHAIVVYERQPRTLSR